MRAFARCVAIAASVGCGGGQKVGTLPAADPAAAKQQAQRLIEQQYEAVRNGDAAAFAASLAPDALAIEEHLVVRGPHQERVRRERAAAEATKELQGPRLSVLPAGMKIGVAPDGHAAWITDELEIGPPDGESAKFRMTALVADDATGTWLVLAEKFSFGVPLEKAFAMAAEGRLPRLTEVNDQVSPGAEGVADALRKGIGDAAAWIASFADRDDAFVFGTAPEEKIPSSQIKKVFGEAAKRYKVQMKVSTGVRAGVTSSGTVGWAFTNVDYSGDPGNGKRVSQPYRVLIVYLKDGDAWRPVQAHFSNGA
jgi:ketosteroid isomerase-like protein